MRNGEVGAVARAPLQIPGKQSLSLKHGRRNFGCRTPGFMIDGVPPISAQYPARPFGNGFFIMANPAARPSAAIPISITAARV